MKSGIELIAQERQEQLEKHGRTVEDDVKFNTQDQLLEAAQYLMNSEAYMDIELKLLCPEGWNQDIWIKMCNKPLKERLVICAALIAAEIDRLQAIE